LGPSNLGPQLNFLHQYSFSNTGTKLPSLPLTRMQAFLLLLNFFSNSIVPFRAIFVAVPLESLIKNNFQIINIF
jgi:phage regulator Rha-like protein